MKFYLDKWSPFFTSSLNMFVVEIKFAFYFLLSFALFCFCVPIIPVIWVHAVVVAIIIEVMVSCLVVFLFQLKAENITNSSLKEFFDVLDEYEKEIKDYIAKKSDKENP